MTPLESYQQRLTEKINGITSQQATEIRKELDAVLQRHDIYVRTMTDAPRQNALAGAEFYTIEGLLHSIERACRTLLIERAWINLADEHAEKSTTTTP